MCHCGTCRTCGHRQYMRALRATAPKAPPKPSAFAQRLDAAAAGIWALHADPHYYDGPAQCYSWWPTFVRELEAEARERVR
jgi:hypothetical protein